jgi:hypothetical protein
LYFAESFSTLLTDDNHPRVAMEASVVPQNRIKAALRNGQPVTGTMIVEFRQASLMQILANAGFDFAIIDNELAPLPSNRSPS